MIETGQWSGEETVSKLKSTILRKVTQQELSMHVKTQDESWWEIGYSHDVKVSKGKKLLYKGETWESKTLCTDTDIMSFLMWCNIK